MTFLPAADVVRLTGGRERYSAQRRALDRMGIRYVTAANGDLDVDDHNAARNGRRLRRRAKGGEMRDDDISLQTALVAEKPPSELFECVVGLLLIIALAVIIAIFQ